MDSPLLWKSCYGAILPMSGVASLLTKMKQEKYTTIHTKRRGRLDQPFNND